MKPKTYLLKNNKNSVVCAYLFEMGRDYCYNIAKSFKKADETKIWTNKSLKIDSYLKYTSRLYPILSHLEKYNLIISQTSKKQKYYKFNLENFLNENVLMKCDLDISSDLLFKYICDFYKKSHFQESFKSEDVIKRLNKWKEFDFSTLLLLNYEDLLYYQKKYVKEGEKDKLKLLLEYFSYYLIFNIRNDRLKPVNITKSVQVEIDERLFRSLQNLEQHDTFIRKNRKKNKKNK